MQHVVGIYEQRSGVWIEQGVALKGFKFVAKIHHPAVRHRAGRRYTKSLSRHKAKIPQKEFLKFRDAANDVLKPSLKEEQIRLNLDDLQTANIKRAQESARVLEECFKLIDVKISEIFKTIRYELYEIEKEI